MLAQLAFGDAVPHDDREKLKLLTAEVCRIIAQYTAIVSFWENRFQVGRLRGDLSQAVLYSGIEAMYAGHEKTVAELVTLARNRGPNAMPTYKDVAYTLVRSQRRKTASIYVERDGSVTVRVPDNLTETEIETLIEGKRYWIHKHLTEWRELNAAQVVREYVNGEGFLYLGRSYRLQWVDDQAVPLLLKGGYFLLPFAIRKHRGSGGSLQDVLRGAGLAAKSRSGWRARAASVGVSAPGESTSWTWGIAGARPMPQRQGGKAG